MPRPRAFRWLAAALGLVALGACTEDVESSAGCPVLCPTQNIPFRDSTVSAVVEGRVVTGTFAVRGARFLPLADRKDTLQTRLVIRFDTLVARYNRNQTSTDTTTLPITAVQTTLLRIKLQPALSHIPDSLSLRVYDVGGAEEDTSTALIESRLVPARQIGFVSLNGADVKDSIRITLSDSAIGAKLNATTAEGKRLRVAVVVQAHRGASALLAIIPTRSLAAIDAPRLSYVPAGTTIVPLAMTPRSATPAALPAVAEDLLDYVTVPVRPAIPDPALLAVGGIPARRSYLRFDLPEGLLDSATIVTAELRFVQRPAPAAFDFVDSVTVNSVLTPRHDTVVVTPLIGTAGVEVSDPFRRATLAVPVVRFSLVDSLRLGQLRLAPRDSGERFIDIGGLLRRWARQADDQPRYLVLAAELEGARPGTVFFFPPASDPALSPRLFIRYIPRISYGLP